MESRMNNDISAKLNCVNTRKQKIAPKSVKISKTPLANDSMPNCDFKDSMAFLGNMGYAQVNLDKNTLNKNVANSVEEIEKNFDYVSFYNEFCDSLIAKGYSLEDAVKYTDLVFDTLSDEKIYK